MWALNGVSPVTSTNVTNSPQNFLTLVYLLSYAGVKFQGHIYCQSQIIELEPRASPKNWFFWSNT